MNDLKRILLVDDDTVFLGVLERAFTRRGFDVMTADNGFTALQRARREPPDGAVVDLKMEGSSGLALIGDLKATNPAMRIVILTGYSSIATAVEAIKLGAENYLCKPASVDEILQAMKTPAGEAAVPIPDNPPSVDRIEWEHIQRVLAEHDGNISATARALGMHRRTLQRKLNKRPVRS